MKAREIVKLCAGSVIVYVVIAACSAGNSDSRTAALAATGGRATGNGGGNNDNGGTTSAMGNGGGGTNGAQTGGALSALLDATVNPVPDAQAATSGTRLKVVYQTGDDGSKLEVPSRFWDSQRNEYCLFGTMYDGVSRCVPTAGDTMNAYGYYTSGTYFSDATCTTGLAAGSLSACSTAPKYVWSTVPTPGNCSTNGAKVYLAGTKYTGKVYILSGTTCIDFTTSIATSQTLYTIGAEVLPSSFVSGNVTHD